MTLSAPRRAALERLLEDWEAGRMTPASRLTNSRAMAWLRIDGLVAWNDNPPGVHYTLTPTGLSAARQARDEQGNGK